MIRPIHEAINNSILALEESDADTLSLVISEKVSTDGNPVKFTATVREVSQWVVDLTENPVDGDCKAIYVTVEPGLEIAIPMSQVPRLIELLVQNMDSPKVVD